LIIINLIIISFETFEIGPLLRIWNIFVDFVGEFFEGLLDQLRGFFHGEALDAVDLLLDGISVLKGKLKHLFGEQFFDDVWVVPGLVILENVLCMVRDVALNAGRHGGGFL